VTDLKPSNIFITTLRGTGFVDGDDGVGGQWGEGGGGGPLSPSRCLVKLADFGLAAAVDPGSLSEGEGEGEGAQTSGGRTSDPAARSEGISRACPSIQATGLARSGSVASLHTSGDELMSKDVIHIPNQPCSEV
jgi:serine/threonine protein kinase